LPIWKFQARLIPGHGPALAEAAKLGGKAAKAGFDWPDWRDLLPKLEEETRELEAEAASGDPARKPAVEAELGDLLFTVDDDLQKADLLVRKTAVENAQQNFDRAKELLKTAAGTPNG